MHSILVLAGSSVEQGEFFFFGLRRLGMLRRRRVKFFGQAGGLGDKFSIFPVKRLNLSLFGQLNDLFSRIFRSRRQFASKRYPIQ